MGSSNVKYERAYKPSCPFGRRCFSDGAVCGYIGYYAECSRQVDDESAELVTGASRGVRGDG